MYVMQVCLSVLMVVLMKLALLVVHVIPGIYCLVIEKTVKVRRKRREREREREERERESGERDKNVTKIKFKILLSDLFYYFYIFRY